MQTNGMADGAAKQERTRAVEEGLRKELHFQVRWLAASCQIFLHNLIQAQANLKDLKLHYLHA